MKRLDGARFALVAAAFASATFGMAASRSASAQPPPAPPAEGGGSPPLEKLAHAEMKNLKGGKVGTVRVRETTNGVIVVARFSGLTPGTHAFHIHDVGKCDPPFDSAGPHFNPTAKKHGFAEDAGWHGGDMPNLEVPQDGSIEVTYFVPGVGVDSGKAALLGGDGAAFVVHAKADDYKTDPSGNAGDRVACGVIESGAMSGADTTP